MHFAFRLATSLQCTVKELRKRMGAREFIRWFAFDQLSPIGGERADYLTAMVSCILANAWSKKRWKLTDFIPNWGKPQKKRGSTQAEIWAWAQRLQAQQEQKKK